MITITQGTQFVDEAPPSSKFVFTNGVDKHIIDEVDNYFTILSGDTGKLSPGIYDYQIIAPSGIVEGGKLKVKSSLLYSDTVAESYWEKVLKACDDKLAGRATSAQNSVTVDGKSISYMSLNELMDLRDFAKQMINEEKAIEEGKSVDENPNSQKVIKYVWR